MQALGPAIVRCIYAYIHTRTYTCLSGLTQNQFTRRWMRARRVNLSVCSVRDPCVALPSGGGSSAGSSPLCGTPVCGFLPCRVPVSRSICSTSCLSLALTLSQLTPTHLLLLRPPTCWCKRSARPFLDAYMHTCTHARIYVCTPSTNMGQSEKKEG